MSSAIPGQSPCGGRRSEPVKLELPRDEPGGLEPCLALHFSSPLLLLLLEEERREGTGPCQKFLLSGERKRVGSNFVWQEVRVKETIG